MLINPDNIKDYSIDIKEDIDFGQVQYLQNLNIMIARSSGRILFFKLERDPKTKQKKWQKYWTLKIRG